jgi:DNA-binding NtrC family response regulator
MGNILVCDDERSICTMLEIALRHDGHHVETVTSGEQANHKLDSALYDVVVTDVRMPGISGMEVLRHARHVSPETKVIVITAVDDNETSIQAQNAGALYVRKLGANLPTDVRAAVQSAMENQTLRQQNAVLKRDAAAHNSLDNIIGESTVMVDLKRLIRTVATTNSTVIITGESGTGKEVISDLLHALSPRSKNKIIKINCAALPRELIESELFGSVKGAFTGAHTDREGLFRQSEGGTLLLDEISEMPIDTQSKLLRVLQDNEVRPVGGKVSYKTNCRVIASTNRKPEDALKEGKLREDLYYRISAISVHLPALRERREDIMPLANAFLKRFAAQANHVINGFTPGAIERLTAFDWPGNVRQLQNEVQRAVLLNEGNEVDVADLSVTNAKAGTADTDTSFTLLEGVERNAIIQTLKETGGNKLETAKRLGIGRQTLYNKIKAYGIEV